MALAMLLVDKEEGWRYLVSMEFSRNRTRAKRRRDVRKRRRRVEERVPEETASLKPDQILCPFLPALEPEQEHEPNFANTTFIVSVLACHQYWRRAADLAVKVLERRSDLT